MRDRAVLCGSASKTYAMTGWRCGWTLGPAAVIAACNAIQSHSTSNVSSISQKAADGGADRARRTCVTEMLDEYRSARSLMRLARRPIRAFVCVKPAGAFYLFPDISEFLSPDGIRTSADLAHRAAQRRPRGGDARRGLRRAWLPPAVVCDLDAGAERGTNGYSSIWLCRVEDANAKQMTSERCAPL